MPADAPVQEQFGYLHFFYVFIYFLTRALTYELLLVLTLFHFSCQDFSASNFKHVFWGYLTYYPMLSASVWS